MTDDDDDGDRNTTCFLSGSDGAVVGILVPPLSPSARAMTPAPVACHAVNKLRAQLGAIGV